MFQIIRLLEFSIENNRCKLVLKDANSIESIVEGTCPPLCTPVVFYTVDTSAFISNWSVARLAEDKNEAMQDFFTKHVTKSDLEEIRKYFHLTKKAKLEHIMKCAAGLDHQLIASLGGLAGVFDGYALTQKRFVKAMDAYKLIGRQAQRRFYAHSNLYPTSADLYEFEDFSNSPNENLASKALSSAAWKQIRQSFVEISQEQAVASWGDDVANDLAQFLPYVPIALPIPIPTSPRLDTLIFKAWEDGLSTQCKAPPSMTDQFFVFAPNAPAVRWSTPFIPCIDFFSYALSEEHGYIHITKTSQTHFITGDGRLANPFSTYLLNAVPAQASHLFKPHSLPRIALLGESMHWKRSDLNEVLSLASSTVYASDSILKSINSENVNM